MVYFPALETVLAIVKIIRIVQSVYNFNLYIFLENLSGFQITNACLNKESSPNPELFQMDSKCLAEYVILL
jgi:hypothetical protein